MKQLGDFEREVSRGHNMGNICLDKAYAGEARAGYTRAGITKPLFAQVTDKLEKTT